MVVVFYSCIYTTRSRYTAVLRKEASQTYVSSGGYSPPLTSRSSKSRKISFSKSSRSSANFCSSLAANYSKISPDLSTVESPKADADAYDLLSSTLDNLLLSSLSISLTTGFYVKLKLLVSSILQKVSSPLRGLVSFWKIFVSPKSRGLGAQPLRLLLLLTLPLLWPAPIIFIIPLD